MSSGPPEVDHGVGCRHPWPCAVSLDAWIPQSRPLFGGEALVWNSVTEFAIQDLVEETVDGDGVEFHVW